MDPFDIFSADTQMLVMFWGFKYFNASAQFEGMFPSTAVIRSHQSEVFFAKPLNALQFRLNSVRDIGLPGPLDFDVEFVGQIVHGPSVGIPGKVRWVVNENVGKTFLYKGRNVKIAAIAGELLADIVAFLPRAYEDVNSKIESLNIMFSNSGPGDSALDLSTPELPDRSLVVAAEVDGVPASFTLGNITLQIGAGSPAKPLNATLGRNMIIQFLDPRVKVDGVDGGISPDPRRSDFSQALRAAIATLALSASLEVEGPQHGTEIALTLASAAAERVLLSVEGLKAGHRSHVGEKPSV
jgi:hypothetical protein